MRIGALEAGGTKMVCAVCDEHGSVLDRATFATEKPAACMPKMIEYFRQADINALGIGCFGPIDPNKQSATYGFITSTPKESWQNFDIVGAFTEGLDNLPIGFDTDVNAAALGVASFGPLAGCKNLVYVTVGTGIGAGILTEGRLLHGVTHAEAGHVLVRRSETDDFAGVCPFHGDCLEGMASGPAIEARAGASCASLAPSHRAWRLEAYYLAQACVAYTLCYSPQHIVFGGGVMKQSHLIGLVRSEFYRLLAGYVQTDAVCADDFICFANLDDNQGILGCTKLV